MRAVKEVLDEYGESVRSVVADATEEVALATVKELKANSPKRTKKYSTGWSKHKVATRLNTTVIVYNRSKPALTWLLNNDHAKRNGGVERGDQHIDMAEDFAVDYMFDKVKEAIEEQ